ncbi:transporter, partial [Streptomyces daliensis]|nr:transporter [Streptomyces daliensis]
IEDRDIADEIEALCLHNVMQQLEHLSAHACVARRLREGSLELHGMYFDVARAQAYVLDGTGTDAPGGVVFAPVRPEHPEHPGPLEQPERLEHPEPPERPEHPGPLEAKEPR